LYRNKSDISSSTLFGTSYKTSFISKKKENSLLNKLKDKITKETLILELREELKYHLKSNTVYTNFLNKIIHLKDIVKENRDKLEQNTEILKETFSERFNIIEKYEKSIDLLGKEKTDIIEESEEIYKLKQNTNEKL
jgi:CRISPR-associated protein Cas8b1/Cst1 subtype I-B